MPRVLSLAATMVLILACLGRLAATPAWAQSPAHARVVAGEGAAVKTPALTGLRGIAVDAGGNLFISTASDPAPRDCIARTAAPPLSLTIFSTCSSAAEEDPSGIAVTPAGEVFLANRRQNTVRRLDLATGDVALVPPADLRAAQNGGGAALHLFEPAGLAADVQENLFIADRGNNRVVALAGAAGNPPGAANDLAHVLDPAAVAVDAGGKNLYVASPASNRIFLIHLSTGDLSVFAGTGAAPDVSLPPANSLPAARAPLAAPEGVAVDAGGNVFIADTEADAIVRVDAKTGMLAPVALDAALSSPASLAIDRRGNLFIADRGNQRVLEVAGVAQAAPDPGVTLTPASLTFGPQPIAGTTPAQTIVLQNNTGGALSFLTTSFAFTGADPGDFAQTNNCPPSVAAGASCAINVTFTPGASGTRSATLQVTDSDPSSPQTASLTGTGDDYEITLASGGSFTETIPAGQTATYQLQIVPDNTFSGTVAIACPTLPFNSTITCTANPASLSVTAGTAAPFSVAFATQARSTVPIAPRGIPPAALLLVAAMLAALGAVRRRSEKRWRGRRALAALALGAALAAAGCYKSPSGPTKGTASGIYGFTVNANAQNASRAISLTLNVE